jgi:hypothetical protein
MDGISTNRAISALARALFPDSKVDVRGNTIVTTSGAVLRGVQTIGRTVIEGQYWSLVGCNDSCLKASEAMTGE